jgi:hypothetical protein
MFDSAKMDFNSSTLEGRHLRLLLTGSARERGAKMFTGRTSHTQDAQSSRMLGVTVVLAACIVLSSTLAFGQLLEWTTPIALNDTSLSAFWPAMAVNHEGNVFVVWSCKNQPANEYYSQLFLTSYNGTKWSPPIAVTDSGKADQTPEIACDTLGYPHLVWCEYLSGEIFYQRFDGQTWSTPLNISESSGASFNPRIVIDHRNRLHVVWDDNSQGNYSVFYRYSDGTTWSATMPLSDTLITGFPSIVGDSRDDLHLTFHGLVAYPGYPLNWEVFYRRYRAGQWESIARITHDSLESLYPAIAVSGADQPVIAWSQVLDETQSPPLTRIRVSYYDGASWSSPYSIADSSESLHPSIAMDQLGKVHVAWELYKRPVPFTCKIMYSSDSGGVWHVPVSLMGPVSSFSTSPVICVDEKEACHVVWVAADHFIYYTHQTTVEAVNGREQRLPLSLSLEQNYPNPFNSQTVISYSILQTGRVTLKVFDILGRELKSLWDGQQEQGTYSVNFDASHLPSGVYYYQLRSSGKALTRAMVVLR